MELEQPSKFNMWYKQFLLGLETDQVLCSLLVRRAWLVLDLWAYDTYVSEQRIIDIHVSPHIILYREYIKKHTLLIPQMWLWNTQEKDTYVINSNF